MPQAKAEVIEGLLQQLRALDGEEARCRVQIALKRGELLVQVKPLVGHGNFLAWVDEHMQFSRTTAEKCMALYEHRDLPAVRDKLQTGCNLNALWHVLFPPKRAKGSKKKRPFALKLSFNQQQADLVKKLTRALVKAKVRIDYEQIFADAFVRFHKENINGSAKTSAGNKVT